MSKPWVTLDERETPDGVLELRRRDSNDFLIMVAGRVLMNSRESRSEEVLGAKTCEGVGAGVGGARALVVRQAGRAGVPHARTAFLEAARVLLVAVLSSTPAD